MTREDTEPRLKVGIRFAVLAVVALAACLIECKIVLAIQTRIQPEYAHDPASTISLGGGDLGNAFVLHAALSGNEISADHDCELILGIDNTLEDKRYVAVDPWRQLELRVTGPTGAVANWSVFEGTVPKPVAQPREVPEMVDAMDLASTHAGFTTLQWPHHTGIHAVHLLKDFPTWVTFRARPGSFHVLGQPGQYHLEIIYHAADGPRTLCDYRDLWVR